LENLADEFAKTIREEMDYNRERAMLEEIRANFADEDRIRIPTAFEAVSGPRVLTMEYIPGTKISDVDALDDDAGTGTPSPRRSRTCTSR